MICAACPDPLDPDDAHDDHEPDCSLWDFPFGAGCTCDRRVHPECCSTCHPELATG